MTQTKVEAPFVEKVHHFKNLIQNGGMKVWQRTTSATTIPSGEVSTVDRWLMSEGTGGSATSEYDFLSDADRATTGHSYALELNCTGADTSIAATDRSYIYHSIEAQNLQHLKYGSSAAETLTLSFWVKSNLTGNFSVSLRHDDNTALYLPLSYTINSANTWEQKVIQISPTAGSTTLITSSTGVFDNDNGRGLMLFFGLVWGSNYTGSQSGTPTWTSSAYYADSDITFTNFYSSTSNNLYITGVQLEVGDQATEFEHVPYEVELRRCQRYFYKHTDPLTSNNEPVCMGNMYSSSQCNGIIHFPVSMRTSPSLICTDASTHFRIYRNSGSDPVDNFSSGETTVNAAEIFNNSDVSGTAGHAATITTDDAAASISFSAEI
jgi:hypothetical protein